jgi:hypothetical protein
MFRILPNAFRFWSLSLLAFALIQLPASAANPPINYGRDILPIFSANCYLCHGPDKAARKAKLRLDKHEGALRVVVPGKAAKSELIRRIASNDPDERMPPPKSHRTLTAKQKELLRRWVDEGAHWGKHWAYETPQRPPLPAVHNPHWCRNPIDRFVLARLEGEGLHPAPGAPKDILIRRVTLDLTGLPPTPKEVDAFLADHSPQAYEHVVDRLLASERYGEQMASDWLDSARYADTNGYQNDFARSMWLWRDWVIRAYNHNMPFDRFTIEQIAGDLLPHPSLEDRIATGFNRNNRTVTEAGSIDAEWRVENNVDRVDTTCETWLGVTMGCARCHDHKFDPFLQKDFYSFFAFFNSLAEKGVYTETRGNVPPLVQVPSTQQKRRLRQLDSDIARVEPAARPFGEDVARITLQAWMPFLPRPMDLAKHKKAAERLAQLRKERAALEKAIPTVMVMQDLPKPPATYVLVRGQYDKPDRGRLVHPDVPGCLTPLPKGAPHNRLGLALWLIDPANPLTARVAVNRYWQHYFGVGLVKTTEDFGVRGEPPSHPDLLDWLATEFVRTHWNIKAMQRLIVTSATYRQSSDGSADLIRRDPENRLLARGPRFRLSAEEVRDNALAISGLLTEKLGGPSVKPYQPKGLWSELAGGAGEGPYIQDKGPKLYRRSLYIYRKRTVPHPVLATFDAPSREICRITRARTDTPLQALELLNDVTYVEAARHLGARMLEVGGKTSAERVTYAFRRATARRPTAKELRVLTQGLERYRRIFHTDTKAAERLIHHGEAPIDPKLDPADLAACTATASVILNLDETITKE